MRATQTAAPPGIHAETLLALVGEGDRAAFEVLYRSTSGLLLGVCLQVLRDRGDAEDVLQETYIAVWNKAAQFDASRSSAMAWLGSIARHRAIDRLRSMPTAPLRTPMDGDVAVDASPSPVALAEQLADRARLDACIEELEAERQTMIRTAFYEGTTYQELAERTHSPLGTVKSWIRRALMQLRACLER